MYETLANILRQNYEGIKLINIHRDLMGRSHYELYD